ncbi:MULTISPECIES: hypothetical protein [Chryseobacterium]|uniref:hypothetical protein n=1 Tax=Chryseobacterium TaxID=59732 RepID=UPI0012951E7D|nr:MULTISPECIES: hypothetical protein [Chryseobacterium]MDR6919174.1 hypothetical protein [Chryseobacterium sp. 2987]
MKLDDIKQEALLFKARNISELSDKIKELKDKEVSFLGLVYFIQHNQQLSLSEARKKTLELDLWTENEKAEIEGYHDLMMREFQEED